MSPTFARQQLDAIRFQLLLESEVRHHRRDDAVAAQLAALTKVLRPQIDDLVAVADLAGVVGEDRAIRVAVERHAVVGLLLDDDLREMLADASRRRSR